MVTKNPLPTTLTCLFYKFRRKKKHMWFFLLNVSFIRDNLISVGSSSDN